MELKPSACLLLLLSCWMSSGLPLESGSRERRGVRLCGKHLVDALALVCGGVYNGPSLSKRARYDLLRPQQAPPQDSTYEVIDSSLGELDSFLDPQTALDLLGATQLAPRKQRGVADECCAKSCNIHTLMTYCGSGRRK